MKAKRVGQLRMNTKAHRSTRNYSDGLGCSEALENKQQGLYPCPSVSIRGCNHWRRKGGGVALMRKCWVIFWTLLWTGGASLALAAEVAPLQKVNFIPQWQPQAQFAGYYVALDKGFYRKHGIEVTILRGGPDMEPSRLLVEGRADFGTMFLSTAVQKRSQGTDLVNIGQLVHCSSLMLVAKKSSGIHLPQDIDGKRVGLWGPEFQVQARAFFNKYRLQVTIVPQAATVNLFLRGGVDVASAMWYNEYHAILNAGVDADELSTFFFFDHGMNFPEDGIYCMASTLEKDPGLCSRFFRASLEGWQYAFDHDQEALDIVMKYVDEAQVATDRAHQQWMLARMRDIMADPRCGIGATPAQRFAASTPAAASSRLSGLLQEVDYQRAAQEILRSGLIDKIPGYTEFYKSCGAVDEK
jgi:NitT/TauT family transport system substrate-binding protein